MKIETEAEGEKIEKHGPPSTRLQLVGPHALRECCCDSPAVQRVHRPSDPMVRMGTELPKAHHKLQRMPD